MTLKAGRLFLLTDIKDMRCTCGSYLWTGEVISCSSLTLAPNHELPLEARCCVLCGPGLSVAVPRGASLHPVGRAGGVHPPAPPVLSL